MSAARSAVVLVFDRLRPSFLGPYGGTWCETPACNRLAAEGYVAEQAWGDAADLDLLYRSYWSGQHAACRHLGDATTPSAATAGRALAERLQTAGVYAELLTDEPQVASHPWGEAFAERLFLPQDERSEAAETAGSMRVAQVLGAAAERWHERHEPTLLWVHAAAWSDAWDAPYEFRQQWADDDDPPPPPFVAPPERILHERPDPDELLGYAQAYAGQVSAWDACLEAWLNAFAASPLASQTLLIVTSPRGYPLGEHQRVGGTAPQLFGELLHVPLLIRLPENSAPLVRDQQLVQPSDLYATLLDWFQISVPGSAAEQNSQLTTATAAPVSLWGQSLLERIQGTRLAEANGDDGDVAAAVTREELLLRTRSWMLRLLGSVDDPDQTELYVKPDDRWEANEVARRCPEEAERLRQLAGRFRWAADRGERALLAPS